jgi:hypothetical protein
MRSQKLTQFSNYLTNHCHVLSQHIKQYTQSNNKYSQTYNVSIRDAQIFEKSRRLLQIFGTSCVQKKQGPYWGPAILEWPVRHCYSALVARSKLIQVFVCRGKEAVIIMLQHLAPPLQHVLEQTTKICAPLVYMTFSSTHPLEDPVWCGMSWNRNEHMVLLDN